MQETLGTVVQQFDFDALELLPPLPAPAARANPAEKRLSELQKSIRVIVGEAEASTGRGLTDDEIYAEYRRRGYPPRSPQRLRTARKEITDPRNIATPIFRDTEIDGTSELGNDAQVWGLTVNS